jgi:hypothetical protein
MNGLVQDIDKNTSLSLDPWHAFFIICGALTAVSGVTFFFFFFSLMPSGPKDA